MINYLNKLETEQQQVKQKTKFEGEVELYLKTETKFY